MSQPTQNPVADPVTTARTLRGAARYLARHGWCQGSYYDQTATCFTPAACVVGAIAIVCYGGPVDAPALHYTAPGFDAFEAAVSCLDGYLFLLHGSDVYSFNDADGRTADQVVGALREVADLIDPPTVVHADYPHQPGTLYDCPACESACFCIGGSACVHCATVDGAA